MRIISGSARGRRLAEFSGKEIRPTPDRVREALFSLLYSRLGSFSGMKVLELFAGSGAMSLEALSRHAQSAIMIEASREAVSLIEENISRCGFGDVATTIRQDVLRALPTLTAAGPFELIFLDPPYAKGLIPQVLKKIDDLNLLSDDGIICAESEADFCAETVGRLRHIESRRYGNCTLHLYDKQTAES